MSNATIVRAWKDKKFRAELGVDVVPAHPAGAGDVRFGLIEVNNFDTSPRCTDGGRACSDPCTINEGC